MDGVLRSLQTKKGMKPSLKLIHARLVAQAGVIAGICAAGVASYVLHDGKPKQQGIVIREMTEFVAPPTMAAEPEADRSSRA